MSAHGQQIPAVYQAAIRRYEEITDKKLDDPALLRLDSVDSLKNEIETRNTKFTEFRSRSHAFFETLEVAMKPIELVRSIASDAAGVAFAPSSLVFGAVSYLVSAASGVSTSYDSIHELMDTLKNFTVRLHVYTQEAISAELNDKLCEILVMLLEVFAFSTTAIRRGRVLKFARNVLLGSDDKIKPAVETLDRLTKTEASLVGAEALTQTKKTGRTVDNIAFTMNSTNNEVHLTGAAIGKMSLQVDGMDMNIENVLLAVNEWKQGAKEEREKNHQDKVKELLKPSITAEDWYDKIRRSRVPGTCDWIRDEHLLKSWFKKDIPVLWVCGNPGAGKSYLSSSIITFLKDEHPQQVQHPSHVSVGYFFFKDDNPTTRSFHQALRDLAYQISLNDPIYQNYIAMNSAPEEISTMTSAWRTLFFNFFVRSKNINSSVYIILDGVDEAFDSEWRTFLSLVQDLSDTSDQSHIQLALVGRPQLSDHIADAVETEVPTIHVTSDKNSADIVHYIETGIRKSNILKRVPLRLQRQIVERLTNGAQGMFLWVDLMLKELSRKRTESAMRKSLDGAPRGLNEMIRHVLEGFSLHPDSDEEPEILNELIAWVSCAPRALKIGELETVLQLTTLEGERVIDLEGALRSRFAAFFTLTREDGLSTADLQQILHGHRDDWESDSDDEGESLPVGETKDVKSETVSRSNPGTTTVTFCHASIGDFLRNEGKGKVSAGLGYPAIGVDYNNAKIHVLKTCLQTLFDFDVASDFRYYAFRHWIIHLKAADPCNANSVEQKDIAGMLARIFQTDYILELWAAFAEPVDLLADETIQKTREWWDDTAVVGWLPSEDQVFITKTTSFPVSILEPLARVIAMKWLQRGYSQKNYPSIIHAYMSLEQGAPLSYFSSTLTAQELVSAAEWAGFERNAPWHKGLAIALRTHVQYVEAIKHFRKAIELDPGIESVKGGLGQTYYLQSKYREALEVDSALETDLLGMADEESSSTAVPSLHEVQERMAKCYKKLHDQETACRYYQKVFRNYSNCNTCAIELVLSYSRKGMYREVFQLLEAMRDSTIRGQGCSRLSDFLRALQGWGEVAWNVIAKAAMTTKRLNFVMEAYRNAAQDARRQLDPVLAVEMELHVAEYCVYLNTHKRAVRIWRKILDTYGTTKEDSNMSFFKRVASVHVAQYLLLQAMEAGRGSPEATRHISRLEDLAKKKSRSGDVTSTFVRANFPAVLLGLWYRLNGRTNDAKDCFRPRISDKIQILSDDDPDNDEEGYYKLCNTLMAAGDDKNVLALIYALGNYTEEREDEEEDEGDDEGDDKGDDKESDCYCNGPCFRSFRNFDKMLKCRYCFVVFCEDCMELLKKDELPFSICDPNHEWLFIPPMPQRIEPGHLLVDGEVVSLEFFLNGLKEQWQV